MNTFLTWSITAAQVLRSRHGMRGFPHSPGPKGAG